MLRYRGHVKTEGKGRYPVYSNSGRNVTLNMNERSLLKWVLLAVNIGTELEAVLRPYIHRLRRAESRIAISFVGVAQLFEDA